MPSFFFVLRVISFDSMKSFGSAMGTRMLEIIRRGSNQIHGTADDVMFFEIFRAGACVLFGLEDMCLMRIVPLRY